MNCLCSRACVCVCLCGLKLTFFLSLIHPSQMPFHLVCFVIIKLAKRSSVSNQSLSIIQFRICFHVLKDLLMQFSTRILHQQNQNYRFVYYYFFASPFSLSNVKNMLWPKYTQLQPIHHKYIQVCFHSYNNNNGIQTDRCLNIENETKTLFQITY